ncbi:MAG: hypothetical protein AAF447_22780 [Myxococcota bacterium]
MAWAALFVGACSSQIAILPADGGPTEMDGGVPALTLEERIVASTEALLRAEQAHYGRLWRCSGLDEDRVALGQENVALSTREFTSCMESAVAGDVAFREELADLLACYAEGAEIAEACTAVAECSTDEFNRCRFAYRCVPQLCEGVLPPAMLDLVFTCGDPDVVGTQGGLRLSNCD